MKKTIIVLTGLMACGKDVTKKYIEEKYGAKSLKFSQIMRDILNRLHLENSRDNIIAVSTILRESFGQDLLAKVITEDAKKIDAPIVILDGARREEDLIYAEQLPSFNLISVDAKPEIRYERAKSRNENAGDAEKTFEMFLEDHKKPTELGIPGLMKKAKYQIDNSGGFEELHKQIDDIMSKILS